MRPLIHFMIYVAALFGGVVALGEPANEGQKNNPVNGLNLYDFKLVAAQSACYGEIEAKDRMESPAACAQACRGTSEMFTFGSVEYGDGDSCLRNGMCKCVCQLTTKNHQCTQRKSNAYDLFAIQETATSGDITQGTQNASKKLKEKQEVEDTIKRLDADIRSFKASLVLIFTRITQDLDEKETKIANVPVEYVNKAEHARDITQVKNFLKQNRFRYTFHKYSKKFTDARVDCQKRGGDMVSSVVPERDLRAMSKDLDEQLEWWVGAKQNNNVWSWANDEQIDAQSIKWGPSYLMKPEDSCPAYYESRSGYAWLRKSCTNDEFYYICEYIV